MDDELAVRMTTADMLLDLGYEVVEASSGQEGSQLIHSGLEIDLLVTDQLMPGLNGEESARQFDHSRQTVDSPGGLPPEFDRLTKPFRIAELAAKLASLGAAVKV